MTAVYLKLQPSSSLVTYSIPNSFQISSSTFFFLCALHSTSWYDLTTISAEVKNQIPMETASNCFRCQQANLRITLVHSQGHYASTEVIQKFSKFTFSQFFKSKIFNHFTTIHPFWDKTYLTNTQLHHIQTLLNGIWPKLAPGLENSSQVPEDIIKEFYQLLLNWVLLIMWAILLWATFI